MTKQTPPKPADQAPAVDDVADQAAASTAGEATPIAYVELVAVASPGAPVVYEGLVELGHGRQARRAYPAIVEAVANPEDPESAVELSYLHRGAWHYVSSAAFGDEPGCWHWQSLPEVAA